MAFGQSLVRNAIQERRLKLRKFPYSNNPLETFLNISKRNDFCYLLESAEGPRKLAQYSFIGFSPDIVIQVKNHKYTRLSQEGLSTFDTDDPFKSLREVLVQGFTPYRGFRFVGGLVGYFSYDTARYLESLPDDSIDDLGLPDLEFGVYNDGIVFDHLSGEAYYYWYDENRVREVENSRNTTEQADTLVAKNLHPNLRQEEFEENVRKVKGYVKAGDIFQAVISKRFQFTFKGELINFYRALREINPSPYMYFLKMGERAIVGSSPEMLGRLDGTSAETFPIAGTRPIGKNRAQDRAFSKELLNDPKERAEHVMLIDLARNDLGKVCDYGTITVPEFMTVQKYSHVQHIVSRVAGRLKPGCDAIDLFKAIFPAGTVSGAPKKRAMEIIDELEPHHRGPYAGAVGYFSYNGNADFAITIRTLVASHGRGFIQAGAGIVADSDPTREWLETEHKADALLHALKLRGV